MVELAAQSLAFYEFRHDKPRLPAFTDVIHGHDIRMIERRRSPCLAAEAKNALLIQRELGRQNLESYPPPEFYIASQINLPHAASAK